MDMDLGSIDPTDPSKFMDDKIKDVLNNMAWETFLDDKSTEYEKEPTYTQSVFEDLCEYLTIHLPEKVEYETSYNIGPGNWRKHGYFFKDVFINFLSTKGKSQYSEFPYSAKFFKKDFPNIYHALCVDFEKIPLIITDLLYERLVLEWRLKKGF